MTIYTITLWLYAVMASLVFGATIYETLVVHPAWSRNPPESFAGFVVPASRMQIAAFWIPIAPAYALSGLAALALAFRAGTQDGPLVLSSLCAVLVVGWTIVYFRPNVARFLDMRGGHSPSDP